MGRTIIAYRDATDAGDGIIALDPYVCIFPHGDTQWKLLIAGISTSHQYDQTSVVDRTIAVLRTGKTELATLVAELIKDIRQRESGKS
jgi:hypothetical protein